MTATKLIKIENGIYNYPPKFAEVLKMEELLGFEYIIREQIMTGCAIYFTDGWCRSFPDIPDYPVLWILTTDTRFEPPFGEVIRLN